MTADAPSSVPLPTGRTALRRWRGDPARADFLERRPVPALRAGPAAALAASSLGQPVTQRPGAARPLLATLDVDCPEHAPSARVARRSLDRPAPVGGPAAHRRRSLIPFAGECRWERCLHDASHQPARAGRAVELRPEPDATQRRRRRDALCRAAGARRARVELDPHRGEKPLPCIRLYGPTEPFWNRSFKLPDFERVTAID
jgi:hypothetical protein